MKNLLKGLAVLAVTPAAALSQTIRYVDKNAPGTKNGLDWFNAYTTLDMA